MEYTYSFIHIETYKFIFTKGDSQHVAGNTLHIFPHLEQIFSNFSIKIGERYLRYLNVAVSTKMRQQDFVCTFCGNGTKYSLAHDGKLTLHFKLQMVAICNSLPVPFFLHHSEALWGILQCFEKITNPSQKGRTLYFRISGKNKWYLINIPMESYVNMLFSPERTVLMILIEPPELVLSGLLCNGWRAKNKFQDHDPLK